MKFSRGVVSVLFLAVSAVAGAAPRLPELIRGKNLVTGESLSILVKDSPIPIALVFVSAHCPCSKSHESELRKLSEDFKNVRLIGIHSNTDETESLAARFFAQEKLPFPVIQDEGARLADALGALKTPHSYVIGVGGREIVYQGGVTDSHSVGGARRFYLREALTALAAGRKPDPAEVRTLGCYIKRAN